MNYLRQSTSATVSFGPFVAPADGVTPVTTLVSALDNATTGIKLCKNGGALTVRHATVTATTYDSDGYYDVTLDTTDTATVGRMRVEYAAAGTNLPVWRDFDVITQAAYDALFSTGAISANVTQIAGQTANAAGAVTFPETIGTSTLGGVAQTGDSYALANGTNGFAALAGLLTNGTYGLSAIQQFLNNGTYGLPAIATLIGNAISVLQGLNNLSQLANFTGSSILRIPDSGSTSFPFSLNINNESGHLMDLTGSPTYTLTDAAGVDLSSYLTAGSHSATGVYQFSIALPYTCTAYQATLIATGTASDGTPRRATLSIALSTLATADALSTITSQVLKIGQNTGDSPNAVTAQTTIATNLNATVASRSTYSGGDADAKAAAIKAQTDLIGTNAADSPNTITAQNTVASLPAAIGNLGSGNIAQPIHIQDANGTSLQGVWVSLIAGADNLGGATDASGNITFGCHSLTYAVTITLTGYQFTPTTLAVSGATSHTYAMTATNLPVAPTGQTTVVCYCHNPDGTLDTTLASNVTVKCTSATVGYENAPQTVNADVNGRVILYIPQGATLQYAAQRNGSGPWINFAGVSTAGPIDLTPLVGH